MSQTQHSLYRAIENEGVNLSVPLLAPMSEEQIYVKQAFNTNWIAPLGPHVDASRREFGSDDGQLKVRIRMAR